jgi:hypothetical protein
VPIKLYDSTIPVDVWYTYVVGVRPGYDGTGHIDLWVNGVQVVNYTGKIGYKPYSVGGLPGTNDSLMVKSGVYRNRPNPNVTFGFDNIKYADNHSQAAP